MVGEGISVTYTYLICPLLFIGRKENRYNEKNWISIYKWALIYFCLLSTIGLIISLIIADNDIMRGLTSSIAFLTVFSMLFVPKKYIDEKALIGTDYNGYSNIY